MERKFKWLLSCLSLGVLLIYSNHHILLQPPEHQKLNHGFYHQECQCYRDINIEQDVVEDTFLNYSSLTCSSFAGSRGFHQKVVTFTFYEGSLDKNTTFDTLKRDYFSGIQTNLKLMQELYGPDWTMRLYYQIPKESQNWKRLCSIVCQNSNIDVCDAENNPMFGNMSKIFPLNWRFVSAMDPQVDLMLVRDLDSEISPREVTAFDEFAKSPQKFHIMRDHPYHGVVILGGTWGVKLNDSMIRKQFKHSFHHMFQDPLFYSSRKNGGTDQTMLKKYVWPWARKIVMAHDSFTCRSFWRTQPFPTQRKKGIGNFVGAVLAVQDEIPFTSKFQCPYKCRPSQHKNWTYC